MNDIGMIKENTKGLHNIIHVFFMWGNNKQIST
jgi:hypothetical protein